MIEWLRRAGSAVASRSNTVRQTGSAVGAGVASASAPDINATTFLDPATLARISNLELLAATVVDGFINGLHRSPHLGMSIEFAEHRAYMPGDDTRRIDWRLYARTDRLYIKEFEAETVMNFSVVLDVSTSMRYTSGGVSKFDYARYLAACLAYFAHGQRDRVGLVTFDDDLVEIIPPSAKHLPNILHAIARARAERPGNLETPCRKLAEHFRRRSMILLISDLYAEPDAVANAIQHLRQRGNEVMVIHVLDRAELDFPFDDSAPFEDMETGDRMTVVPVGFSEEYRTAIQGHIAALRTRLQGQGVGYAMFDTTQPLDYALYDFLSKRQRLMRVR